MPADEGAAPLTASPLDGATGRGVRVAVIDSGVHAGHPHIGAVADGVAVESMGVIPGAEASRDRLGHGTAVMAAIQEKAPDAHYVPVKVFHTALRTSAAVLLRAIDWCLEQQFDVVNLSLGSPNPAHAEIFAEAARRASAAGVLLVSARDANGERCWPGSLPAVISVGLDWDWPREQYRCETVGAETVFYASGYPRPAPGVPPMRNLHGVSFAVANMSGFVARACEVVGQGAGQGARLDAVRAELIRAASVRS